MISNHRSSPLSLLLISIILTPLKSLLSILLPFYSSSFSFSFSFSLFHLPYFTLISISLLLINQSIPQAQAYSTLSFNLKSSNVAIDKSSQYADGTLLFRLQKRLNDKCSEPKLQFLVIDPNGNYNFPNVNFTFPGFNFCRNFSNENTVQDYISFTAFGKDLAFVEYMKKNSSMKNGFEEVGLVFNITDGSVFKSDISLGTPQIVNDMPIPGILTANMLVDDGGVLHVMGNNDNTGVKTRWSEFKQPNKSRIVEEYASGEFLDSKIKKTLFPTAAGGYGVGYLSQATTKNNRSDPTDFKYLVYVAFLRPEDSNFMAPFLIYQTTYPLNDLQFIRCHPQYDVGGYACILQADTTENVRNQTIPKRHWIKVAFLSSGSIKSINKLDIVTDKVIDIIPMPKGGYLVTTFNITSRQTSGLIYKSDGKFNSTWDFPESITLSFSQVFGIFPNNTLWEATLPTNKLFSIATTDLPKFLENDKGYNNPWVVSSIPEIDSKIDIGSTNVSITFKEPIRMSVANMSIFQSAATGDILRQTYKGSSSDYVHVNEQNVTTVNFFTLPSTFNQPGENYYIVLDGNFVTSIETGEPLWGIQKGYWNFNTKNTSFIYAEEATGLLRLTLDGTYYLKNLSGPAKPEFFKRLLQEIAETIPIDVKRLSTTQKYQYDPDTGKTRYLIPLTIAPTNDVYQRNADDVCQDLDTLVRFRNITPISMRSSTIYLDRGYGFRKTESLWSQVKFPLLGGVIGLFLLCLIFLLFRRINPEANNLMVFFAAFILLDFALDITFLVLHGNDVPWLFLPSLLVLTIPAGGNLLITASIIISETARSQLFAKWFRNNTNITLILTLLGAADVEILRLLWSKLLSLRMFSAPISNRARATIFWMSTLNLIMEDIPQLIIQILYIKNTVSYNVIPFLTLITSIIMLAHNVFGRIFLGFQYVKSSSFYLSSRDNLQSREQIPDLAQNISQLYFPDQTPPQVVVPTQSLSFLDEDEDTVVGGSSFPEGSRGVFRTSRGS
ncbi:hypothetical protein G9A89_006174 [Geosiphon pyriformis]|nr:hypothetical protein G9A89_006174 [Geosiphon pyriformis]